MLTTITSGFPGSAKAVSSGSSLSPKAPFPRDAATGEIDDGRIELRERGGVVLDDDARGVDEQERVARALEHGAQVRQLLGGDPKLVFEPLSLAFEPKGRAHVQPGPVVAARSALFRNAQTLLRS